MTVLDRRAVLRRVLAGAVVAAASASLLPSSADAALLTGAIPDDIPPGLPVEEAAVRTSCWWRRGRRVCVKRPARRVCWRRRGRRVCHWR